MHLVAGTTGIETVSSNLPGKIKFYPNPAKDQTRMQFELPEPGETMINMLDLAGREIGQTRNMLPQGRYTYLVQGVAEGLYIVRINSGSYSFSGRLISSFTRNTDVRLFFESPDTNTTKQEEEGNSKGINDIELMNYNPGEILKYMHFQVIQLR